MEKEHKIIIITEEIKRRKLVKKYHYCYKQKKLSKGIKQKILKAEKILLYDVTKTNEKEKRLHINDHINKTGESPLIKTNPLEFIDISSLYKKEKKGRTTTGLGKRFNKEKNNHPYPSTFMCIIAILCKKINPKIKIQAKIINCL